MIDPDFDPYQDLLDIQSTITEIVNVINGHGQAIERLADQDQLMDQRLEYLKRDIQNINNRLTRLERR